MIHYRHGVGKCVCNDADVLRVKALGLSQQHL